MFGININNALYYLMLLALIICSVAIGHYQRKAVMLTEQNRTLQRENQLLETQQKSLAKTIELYQLQAQQLNSALQQQKQHADRRSEQLNEALKNEHNQTWRNQPVPDDIKRLFNTDSL